MYFAGQCPAMSVDGAYAVGVLRYARSAVCQCLSALVSPLMCRRSPLGSCWKGPRTRAPCASISATCLSSIMIPLDVGPCVPSCVKMSLMTSSIVSLGDGWHEPPPVGIVPFLSDLTHTVPYPFLRFSSVSGTIWPFLVMKMGTLPLRTLVSGMSHLLHLARLCGRATPALSERKENRSPIFCLPTLTRPVFGFLPLLAFARCMSSTVLSWLFGMARSAQSLLVHFSLASCVPAVDAALYPRRLVISGYAFSPIVTMVRSLISLRYCAI